MQTLSAPGIQQRGAILLALTLFISSFVLSAFLLSLTSVTALRDQSTADALAEARDALIGFGAIYPENYDGETFGYLPCPNIEKQDFVESRCGSAGTPAIGRLPWKKLGIPPLRDATGECLWYTVASGVKYNPKYKGLNWDTLGQFIITDTSGNALTGTSAHARPLAIVLAPGTAHPKQDRHALGNDSECGGSLAAADYLEQLDPNWNTQKFTGDISIVAGHGASRQNLSHNDQAAWIDANDLFTPIKQRSDFIAAINTLMSNIATYLNSMTPETLPSTQITTVTSKIPETLIAECKKHSQCTGVDKLIFDHWRDHLFYAKSKGAAFTVPGSTGPCLAVLIFGGERTPTQTRSTGSEREDLSMYLENNNAKELSGGGRITGTLEFKAGDSSADIVHCITGSTPKPQHNGSTNAAQPPPPDQRAHD